VKLAELKARRNDVLTQAIGICNTAIADDNRPLTEDEKARVGALQTEAEGYKGQIKALEDDEALKAAIIAFGAGMEQVPPASVKASDRKAVAHDIASMLLDSAEYKSWIGSAMSGGRIPDGARLASSPPFSMPALLKSIGYKALVTGDSATSAGAFVEPDYTGIYEPLGRRALNLLDLIPRRRTTSDIVWFVRQTAMITQATTVAEANVTTYAGATGEVSGEKPEGTLTFEQANTNVKTIAVWIPVSRRALSDAAQIRGIIDQELREDVQEELEDQIYDGDGVGENFLGITVTPNVLTQAWDTDALTTIRKARTAVEVTGRSRPTGLAIHPNDAEMLDLLKDGDNRFYFGGPIDGGADRVWRVPVVVSEAVAEGQGILADWRKCVMWDREQATITMSDSHSDFFIRNLIAVLCELRAAFAVVRPAAFCLVDLTSGS